MFGSEVGRVEVSSSAASRTHVLRTDEADRLCALPHGLKNRSNVTYLY
jgi:hypothetical protein